MCPMLWENGHSFSLTPPRAGDRLKVGRGFMNIIIWLDKYLNRSLMLAAVALVSACTVSTNGELSAGVGLTEAPKANAQELTITDEAGTAIAGAQLLIGSEQGKPFTGNLLTADAQGKI